MHALQFVKGLPVMVSTIVTSSPVTWNSTRGDNNQINDGSEGLCHYLQEVDRCSWRSAVDIGDANVVLLSVTSSDS